MKYHSILRNEHFNNLAANIRVPLLSPGWRKRHPHVPLVSLEKQFSAAVFNDVWNHGNDVWNHGEVLTAFVNLITAIVEADERLHYSKEDMDWFVQVLEGDNAPTVMALFCTWYRAPDTFLTPAEIAEKTGTAESTWRNKAAAGAIPGAIKKGKQWLLPQTALRSQGVNV